MPTKKTDASTDDVSPAPRRRTRAATSKSSNEANTYTPSEGEIAEAAYLRYVNRGGVDGADFDDWLEAERELNQKQKNQKH